MPTVSIIIPCFNQGSFIKDAILSVLGQTYNSFEIIVVNDGSTELDTIEILQNLNYEKTRVLHTPNFGLAEARNYGIKAALGKYILPLDADDKISPSYLERAVGAIEQDIDLKIVYCKAAFFGNQSGAWQLPPYSLEGMLKQNLIFCTALFRKEDFDRINGYNSNMKFGWEDWDLWLSILEGGGKVFQIPEILFFYRKHSYSMVASIEEQTYKRQYLEKQLVMNHLKLYQQFFPAPLTLLRELENLKLEKQNFEKVKEQIFNSYSYRLGHKLLMPIKWFANIKKG